MKNRKRIVILAAVLVCLCLLAAWGKTVELLDRSKLIDLDIAIQKAPIGHQGNTTDLSGEHEDKEDPELNNHDEPENPPEDKIEETGEKTKLLTVSIRDREIRFCGNVVRDEDMLRESLMKEFREGTVVTLIDDYAEAHVYRTVNTMLMECVGSSLQYEMSE